MYICIHIDLYRQSKCTIFHADPPSPPLNPKLLPQSLTSATLSWTAPNDSICVTGYIVTLINVTEEIVSQIYNVTTNVTSITVSELTQRAEYYFTMVGVDIGGRVGKTSVLSESLTLDSKWWHMESIFLASSVTNRGFLDKITTQIIKRDTAFNLPL